MSTTKTMKSREISFVTGSLTKEMLRFSAPFMLGVLIQNLYGAVDLLVVGHFATTADVSAVTIGSQLMTVITQLIIGLATGITIMVGQGFGAKDQERLARTTGSSILLFGIIGAALTFIYIFSSNTFISAMQTPPEAVNATGDYLFICSLGIIFIVGFNVVSCILNGLGDSKTPFIFICVACVINVALDIILVKQFNMGAKGAAIATTIAQAGSFIFSLIFLLRKGLGFPMGRSYIRFYKQETIHTLKIGAPVAIQNALVGLSFLFITAIINQMGLAASAAVGVVEKLITFLFVPAIGMGTAVSTAAAQNLGAGQPDRARKSMWNGIILALIPSVLIFIACQFWGVSLASIFGNNSEVISLANDYLRSYVTDVIMVSFVFCMNGYFNSCDRSWFSLLHSIITTFAVRIPLASFFSGMANANLFTIGWAAPLSTLVSFVLCLIFLAKLSKEKRKPDYSHA